MGLSRRAHLSALGAVMAVILTLTTLLTPNLAVAEGVESAEPVVAAVVDSEASVQPVAATESVEASAEPTPSAEPSVSQPSVSQPSVSQPSAVEPAESTPEPPQPSPDPTTESAAPTSEPSATLPAPGAKAGRAAGIAPLSAFGTVDACSYASNGLYKDNLCWLNFDSFTSQEGAAGGDRTNCTTANGVMSCDVANYPVSFTLPGGLRFSAKLNTKGINPVAGSNAAIGRFVQAVGLPISGSWLGSTKANAYAGITGKPALYQGTDGALFVRAWTEVKLSDIQVKKPDGSLMSGHGLLWADAEQTLNFLESIAWTKPSGSGDWTVLNNSGGNPRGDAALGRGQCQRRQLHL